MEVPGYIAVGLTLCFARLVCVQAVYIPGCPLEVVENSADVQITCTDISPSDQVVWQYKPADRPSSDAGTCNPLPQPCINKLSNLMSINRTSETTSVLTIANATRALYAEAAFTCSTFRRSSLSGSTSCRLNVIYPPEMMSFTGNDQHGTVTLNESDGEAVALTCIADGYPTPQLTLFKNEQILKTVASPRSPEKITALQHYVLRSCESTDRYTCVANNTAGPHRKSLFLEILCGPRPTFPQIPSSELSVETNLTMNITAVPSPQVFDIVRLRNGTETAIASVNSGDFHIQCQNVTMSNHVCTLTIDYVAEEEEGEYALDVSNEVGDFRFRFHLSAVHSRPGKPSFLVNNSNTSVSMPESAAALPMVCTASGTPRPDVKLKKDNITLKEEEGSQSRDRKSTTLDFAVMARCDSSGVYTCLATNSAGTVQTSRAVKVFCAPSFYGHIAEVPNVSADRNWTVHLIALPPPDHFEFVGLHNWANRTNHCFYVDCSPVTEAQHRCVVSVSEPTLDDKGDYTLIVGNRLGKTALPFYLDVPEERNPEKDSGLYTHPSGQSESSSAVLLITAGAGAVAGVLIMVHILVAIILTVNRLRRKRNTNGTTGPAQSERIFLAVPRGFRTQQNSLVPDAHGQGATNDDADDDLVIMVANESRPGSTNSSRASTLGNGVRLSSGPVAVSQPALTSQRDRSITHPKRVSESASAAEQNPRPPPSVPANGPGPGTTGSDETAAANEISATRGITRVADTGDQPERECDDEHTCGIHRNKATRRAIYNPEYVSPDVLCLRHSNLKCSGVTNPGFDESEA